MPTIPTMYRAKKSLCDKSSEWKRVAYCGVINQFESHWEQTTSAAEGCGLIDLCAGSPHAPNHQKIRYVLTYRQTCLLRS